MVTIIHTAVDCEISGADNSRGQRILPAAALTTLLKSTRKYHILQALSRAYLLMDNYSTGRVFWAKEGSMQKIKVVIS